MYWVKARLGAFYFPSRVGTFSDFTFRWRAVSRFEDPETPYFFPTYTATDLLHPHQKFVAQTDAGSGRVSSATEEDKGDSVVQRFGLNFGGT